MGCRKARWAREVAVKLGTQRRVKLYLKRKKKRKRRSYRNNRLKLELIYQNPIITKMEVTNEL